LLAYGTGNRDQLRQTMRRHRPNKRRTALSYRTRQSFGTGLRS
jgi:hypothetical protein